MDPVTAISERKIRESMERGEFSNLPGAGRPLRLEDDSMVPEAVRLAYRILRSAGYLPPELELRKEILALRDLLRTVEDGDRKAKAVRELNFLLLKLNVSGRRAMNLDDFPEYRERILERMAG
ncbi:MAG TPA: DnaJ family domain-containing protein [Candidatus Aquicultoraceae bacterium]|nr:DnaJ family domain-containing protein [Candidatus Aquicultoraceae bacterium]